MLRTISIPVYLVQEEEPNMVQTVLIFHCFSKFQTKSVLSTKLEASRQGKNIPKSPAVGDTAETIKSPRRKLPAPRPKSVVSMETTDSPVPEKENDNPEERLTSGNQNQKDISASPSVQGRLEDMLFL